MINAIQQNIINNREKAIRFGIGGAIGSSVGVFISELFIGGEVEDVITLVLKTGIWFGIIGAGIAAALLLVSYHYLKREWLLGKALRDGVGIGLVAGGIAGAIAQYTYTSIGPTEALRIVCWGIAGGLLGFGLSFRVPNLGKWRGLGGGLLGGLGGGTIFVLLVVASGLPETIGRLFGTAVIGFFIGLMIVLIESVFREAWLEVRYNPREVRTVSLGKEPVTIGGNSKLCTVYVPSSPPVAYRYQLHDGKIICEDVVSNTTRNLHPGEEQTLGRVTIAVCASASSSTQGMSQSQKAFSELPPTILSSSQNKPSVEISLHIKRQVFPLKEGTCLTPQEILGLESLQKDGIVARVEPNPNNPAVLGLKNCSYRPWNATLPTGEEKVIDSGRSIKLAVGTQINFGPVKGEIK